MKPIERVSSRFFLDLARFQTDVWFATGEMLAGTLTSPLVLSMVPKGNYNKRVLTIPGFTGPEFSLSPLNSFLTMAGYPTESWGLGTNTGPQGPDYYNNLSEVLGERLKQMVAESGEPVALIGQSLGGLYAREVARDHPDLVDRVITLGSPVYLKSHRLREMNHMVATFFRFFKGASSRTRVRRKLREHRIAPPVPLVAIYSKFDGILSWQSTRIPNEDLRRSGPNPRENIEIMASHCGMAVNPLVLLALCDRLHQDRNEWERFEPRNYIPHMGALASVLWYPPQPDVPAGPPAARVPYLRVVKN